MTPDELREARRKLGLSTAKLAAALRLKGGGRTVRRWEAGDRAISGPLEIALETLLGEQQEREARDRRKLAARERSS